MDGCNALFEKLLYLVHKNTHFYRPFYKLKLIIHFIETD